MAIPRTSGKLGLNQYERQDSSEDKQTCCITTPAAAYTATQTAAIVLLGLSLQMIAVLIPTQFPTHLVMVYSSEISDTSDKSNIVWGRGGEGRGEGHSCMCVLEFSTYLWGQKLQGQYHIRGSGMQKFWKIESKSSLKSFYEEALHYCPHWHEHYSMKLNIFIFQITTLPSSRTPTHTHTSLHLLSFYPTELASNLQSAKRRFCEDEGRLGCTWTSLERQLVAVVCCVVQHGVVILFHHDSNFRQRSGLVASAISRRLVSLCQNSGDYLQVTHSASLHGTRTRRLGVYRERARDWEFSSACRKRLWNGPDCVCGILCSNSSQQKSKKTQQKHHLRPILQAKHPQVQVRWHTHDSYLVPHVRQPSKASFSGLGNEVASQRLGRKPDEKLQVRTPVKTGLIPFISQQHTGKEKSWEPGGGGGWLTVHNRINNGFLGWSSIVTWVQIVERWRCESREVWERAPPEKFWNLECQRCQVTVQ